MQPNSKAEQLAQRLGGVQEGQLVIGGVPLGRILETAPTPCYVYSGDVVQANIRGTQQALGPDTDLYYSLKANPSLGLCQLIAREGIGAEVASGGELLLAQAAGFPADKTIFAGPGKTDEELELAVSLGIRSINVESLGEMRRLGRIAQKHGRQVTVCLRVNPSTPVKGAQMHMGGGSQQFGIDMEMAPEVVGSFRDEPRLRIAGVHVYAGTQVFDIGALLSHFNAVVDMAVSVGDLLGRPLEMVDFGGGFGVPYFEHSPEFDLARFADGYCRVIERCKEAPRLANTQPMVELGRFLVADAGIFATRVIAVKRSRGKTYLVTDGGMNHHITATGNFGQVFRKPYPLAVLNRMGEQPRQETSVVGPCCTPLDVFAQGIALPPAEVGDIIGVFYSGAYGYSASSLAFLSHPTPAEVLVWNGEAHVLRPPGRADQVLQGQQALASGRSAAQIAG